MRLAFWRTEKPVARPVLQPGADSPYVPRLGVWMATNVKDLKFEREHGSKVLGNDGCWQCGAPMEKPWRVSANEHDEHPFIQDIIVHEGCGAKLVAKLRREREG